MPTKDYVVRLTDMDSGTLSTLGKIILPVLTIPAMVAIYAIKQMTVPTDGAEFLLFAAMVAGLGGYVTNEIWNKVKIKNLKQEHEQCLDELKKGEING